MNFLKEPLLHFLLIGVALFFIYHVSVDHNTLNKSQDLIVVSNTDIERLTLIFKKTWNRNPNSQELKSLIDDYVKEEILYREALKLGLDKDDTIVRRRMRQKMEFFINDISNETEPSEEDLSKFFKENKEKFTFESEITFYQLFFEAKVSNKTNLELDDLKNQLNQKKIKINDTKVYSESIILPFFLDKASESEVNNKFGKKFNEEIIKQEKHIWSGPINSTYGYHLVYIDKVIDEYIPELSEIRNLVEEEWKLVLNKKLENKYFEEKLNHYKIKINWSEEVR